MKKLLFVGIFAAGIVANSNVNAQAVEEGNVIVDVYYGFPNLYTSVFKTSYANSAGATDLKISGLGPLGLRGEYMIADKFGVGIDIGFNNTKIVYNEISSVYNSTTNTYNDVNYEYTFSTQKIGVLATFNYHFLDNDKVDAYGVFGIGYGNRSFDFTSTDPNYTAATISGLIPVASKIGVGFRYFFTDNIGANMALGFGQGGVVNIGLSAKF